MASSSSSKPAAKSLSNGTLSLRFMQRKIQAQVELEAAEVADDSKWEVSQEIRDAWGVDPKRSERSGSMPSRVSYEPSYLPFLFPSLPDPSEIAKSPVKVRGRRAFGKNGQETLQEETITAEAIPEPIDSDDMPTSLSQTPQRATGSRKPISVSGTNGVVRRGEKTKTKKNRDQDGAPKKSVKDLLREDLDVGMDMRAIAKPSSIAKTVISAPPVFLKPAGVDTPKTNSKLKEVPHASLGGNEKKKKREHAAEGGVGDVIDGARKKSKKVKIEQD